MVNKTIPVVILAGGNGTMLGSTKRLPKPMVEIDGHPLLEHVIAYFCRFGFRWFIVAAGQGEELIKDFIQKAMSSQRWPVPDLSIEVVHTGIDENTGARLAILKSRLTRASRHILTYGDVIADVPLEHLLKFHDSHGRLATLTAVHAPTRFRILGLHNVRDDVLGFADEPILQKDYISGGFYVLSRKVLDLPVVTTDRKCSFEFDVLQDLVVKKQLMAYRHEGYWQSLDTERDMLKLGQYLRTHHS